jgi:hypothetical protein
LAMQLPDEFLLKRPFYNGFADKDDPAVLLYLEQHNALNEKFAAGKLFVKFIDGDRKGSIARVKPNVKTFGDKVVQKATIERRYNSWNNNEPYYVEHDRFYGILSWDGRKNSVQMNFPDKDAVFLPNYEGPTVWELFDHKAAKEEALKKPDQLDIDGKTLAVGDEVLYINARYGYGMELSHGKIKQFKATVDSRKTEMWTIVENAEGIESKISNSSNMIFKKS